MIQFIVGGNDGSFNSDRNFANNHESIHGEAILQYKTFMTATYQISTFSSSSWSRSVMSVIACCAVVVGDGTELS